MLFSTHTVRLFLFCISPLVHMTRLPLSQVLLLFRIQCQLHSHVCHRWGIIRVQGTLECGVNLNDYMITLIRFKCTRSFLCDFIVYVGLLESLQPLWHFQSINIEGACSNKVNNHLCWQLLGRLTFKKNICCTQCWGSKTMSEDVVITEYREKKSLHLPQYKFLI